MVAGTVVLALTAIFATKANKKFTAITTAYFAASSGNIFFYDKSGTDFLTDNLSLTPGQQLKMAIRTTGGIRTSGALITVGHTSNDKVYYH